MKTHGYVVRFVLLLLLGFLAVPAMAASSYPINYQGKLSDKNGVPANGSFAMVFKLYDAATGGNQIGTSCELSEVKVTNGLFNVALDFPETSFDGNPRYLEIAVGGETLPERKAINWAPQAIYAATAGSAKSVAWDSIANAPTSLTPSGSAGGSLTGSYPNPGIADNTIGNTNLVSDRESLAKVSGGVMAVTPFRSVGIGTSNPAGTFEVCGPCETDIIQQPVHNNSKGFSYFWQSFTASSTTYITSIEIYAGSSDSSSWTGTLTVYDGEGTGGVTLGSKAVSGAGLQDMKITLQSPIPVTEGHKYTFALNTQLKLSYLVFDDSYNDTYTGGTLMWLPKVDAKFHVYGLAGAKTQLACILDSAHTSYNIGIGTTAPAAKLQVTPSSSGPSSGILLGDTYPNATGLVFYLSQLTGGYSVIQSVKTSGASYGDIAMNPNGGSVVIGPYESTAVKPNYTLFVDGPAGGTSAYSNLSDGRYKKNVQPLNHALSKVLRLRGVSYDWDHAKNPKLRLPSGRQVGFIAQEVQKVLPEAVNKDTNGTLSITYSTVTPLVVEGIKQQQKQIEQLKKRLRSQRAEIDTLKSQISAIKALLNRSVKPTKVAKRSRK